MPPGCSTPAVRSFASRRTSAGTDKVLGAELRCGRLPLSDHILFVSGRTSFEIIQKAVMAGVAVVAAVSAPSSLAIDLARAANVTLLGFVRGAAFNIYAHAERVHIGVPEGRSHD
jgi:FdhD protein